MKIYISADIEGVAGITHADETRKTSSDYGPYQQQMTAEVAAAAEAALDAGAHEVWIKDAHHTGRNLVPEGLPRATRLIRGWSGHPLSMVQELDESFAAVVMIGYHARAGSGGNPLSHTMNGRLIHRITVNGLAGSEFLLHSYAAALYGVPVVVVAGDRALCDEVEAFDPRIRTVATLEGVGDSTISIHPAEATDRIRGAVTEALTVGSIAAPALPDHFVVELRFKRPEPAYRASFYPGVTSVDDDTIRFESGDWFEVMRMLSFVI